MIELKSLADWDFEILAEGSVVGRVQVLWEEVPRLDCSLPPQEQGKGYALAACNEVLELLENEDLPLVCAHCNINNAAALRLFSRLGFELKRIRGNTMVWEAIL